MKPIDVDAVTMAFPAGIKHLMPPREQIEAYKSGWGGKLFNDWFFCGLKSLELMPKEGIDKSKALRHIRTIMGSFEPKHEHKEAAVALLLEEWFEPGKWECKPFDIPGSPAQNAVKHD